MYGHPLGGVACVGRGDQKRCVWRHRAGRGAEGRDPESLTPLRAGGGGERGGKKSSHNVRKL